MKFQIKGIRSLTPFRCPSIFQLESRRRFHCSIINGELKGVSARKLWKIFWTNEIRRENRWAQLETWSVYIHFNVLFVTLLSEVTTVVPQWSSRTYIWHTRMHIYRVIDSFNLLTGQHWKKRMWLMNYQIFCSLLG